ncbi:hypothetical protein GE21DRAFT_4827 [Neurospora crassa]|uniref:Uncharacterized protein n=1 Tax=Neurospora crassa (strain ATCC 24698 / 74-OR23-1A / CBS 708.71 / DSM 1257 / FGSC 987) TaxID=367110 RepID=Q7RWT7_NEUCR|nr:hypothetical protein NCU00491 [Neurospora crassa OR74A]EAA26940.1 hypothetical protein NCU00491 [Neurospora crassa OR74A]KHE79908.1 hypothetical protein GE21DRAFT_4827 [Neurospora crassa]|eukprot:XP_956176.1 hypothetical protein NCU00491 [Neurospora crassa OR74A]
MEPKRFKNHKRRGFGTPVGDVVEPLDISMATWSLSRLGGRPYLLVSQSRTHPKAPELGQDHLLPCISTSMYSPCKKYWRWLYQTNTLVSLGHHSHLGFPMRSATCSSNVEGYFRSLVRAARPAPSFICPPAGGPYSGTRLKGWNEVELRWC